MIRHYIAPTTRVFHWYVWDGAYPLDKSRCEHVWTLEPNTRAAVLKWLSERRRRAAGIFLLFNEELNTGAAHTVDY